MKLFSLIVCLSFWFASSAQIPNCEVRDLKGGRVEPDTSPIYRLPWKLGSKVLLVQGWQSEFSHKGELAQDFKMKVNTPIYAARGVVVTRVKLDGTQAGLKDKYLTKEIIL